MVAPDPELPHRNATTARARLTVPEIPYSEIERRGATMYRGQRGGGADGGTPGDQPGGGGSTPTPPLQLGLGSPT